MENIVSEKIDRRKFLAGAGAGSLVLVSLGGCGSSQVRQPGTPHYGMVFDQNKCVGCRDCRIACNETNKLPKGVTRLLLELQDDKIEGKRGYAADRRYVRVSCQQCSDAPCVTVCPTGAAHRDPKTGIVTMYADKCVGCKYCIVACPYNARFINEETKVADNCDFCLHTRLEKGQQPASGSLQEPHLRGGRRLRRGLRACSSRVLHAIAKNHPHLWGFIFSIISLDMPPDMPGMPKLC